MPTQSVITKEDEKGRFELIQNIIKLKGKNFTESSNCIEHFLNTKCESIALLLGHIRLCGVIPENYQHDSTEEKLYSKYTDILISLAFSKIGFKSTVLTERGNAADVECNSEGYSFVADAKAFRLSRTAKNQKDFKIESLDNWKKDKDFAVLVCPIYQLPKKESQIYTQCSTKNVCIITYTHLATILKYSQISNNKNAIMLLYKMFESVKEMAASENAYDYWQALNKSMVNFDKAISKLWTNEKLISIEAISFSKKEALFFLLREKKRIINFTTEEAVKEILKLTKIDAKVEVVNKVSHGILEIDYNE